MKKKTVIILTVGLGGGHKAMASNLSSILDSLTDSPRVLTVDILKEAWPLVDRYTSKAYAGSTSHFGAGLFKLYYVLTDRFPQPLRWITVWFLRSTIIRLFKKHKPALVIGTFPFLADAAATARKATGSSAQILQTITDARHVQGIWLSSHADLTLTATNDTVPYLIKRGMEADKIKYLGFPADKQLYGGHNSSAIRRSLGLEPTVFTILLTAGGQGLHPDKVVSVAEQIASTIKRPYQIVLNAGHNLELKWRFENINFLHATKVIVEGFTDKMIEYLQSADVICTKSGWLTVNEALALQKPLILYDAIPGHEEQNVRYVVDNHFGVYAPEPDMVVSYLDDLAKKPTTFDTYIDAMKRAGTHRPPHKKIARLLEGYLNNIP